MSALLNDRPSFKRRHRKRRKNWRLSRELLAVLDMDRQNEDETAQVERLLWAALLAEHGEEAVMEAIEEAQRDFDGDALLPTPTEQTLPQV